MKISYIFILIFAFMLFPMRSYADSYMVSDVLIKGLKNVSLRSVLSVIDLKKGKLYSKYQAKKDVASITSLGYFNDVKIHFNKQNGNLVFEVNEDPFIERIVFRGNLEFSTSKLKTTSALKEKDYYDFSKLEETKKKIKTLYISKGYVDCKIEVYPTVNADTNKMTVTFLITENNKIVVGDVKVKGVIHFKEEKILKVMKTRCKKVFKEDIYQMDLKSIETFYKNNGFIDYKFVSLTTEYNDAKTEMFLTLNINEGNKYKIGSVTYSGNFIIDDVKMKKIIKIEKGKIFNQYEIEETVGHILKSYFNKGYLNAVVKPCFNKKYINGTVDVNFLIEENEVFYLGNIYIRGLDFTKDKVIRREMLLKPGAVFVFGKLLRSIERINNLGFIKSVEHIELPTEASNIIDLELYVTESTNSAASVSFGYSKSMSFTGLLQLQYLNMFGLGQKLNLLFEISKNGQHNYEISWVEPWIFDKNMSLTFDIYKRKNIFYIKKSNDNKKENNIESTKIDNNDERTGFEVKLSPRISERISLSFGYRYENVDFRSITTTTTDKINMSSISTSIFSHFLYDSRDYIFDPSKGSVNLVTLQMASSVFGGKDNFIKGIFDSTWFFSTFWKFVLSANLRLGLIKDCGSSSVPIYERLYIGGSDGVRGYDMGEIMPYEGGKLMWIINIEHRFPIFSKDKKTIIQGFLFYDAGNLFGYSKKDCELYQSVGFGIRLPIPFFPIRLDFAYGLTKRNERDKHGLKFYFTLGNIF